MHGQQTQERVQVGRESSNGHRITAKSAINEKRAMASEVMPPDKDEYAIMSNHGGGRKGEQECEPPNGALLGVGPGINRTCLQIGPIRNACLLTRMLSGRINDVNTGRATLRKWGEEVMLGLDRCMKIGDSVRHSAGGSRPRVS